MMRHKTNTTKILLLLIISLLISFVSVFSVSAIDRYPDTNPFGSDIGYNFNLNNSDNFIDSGFHGTNYNCVFSTDTPFSEGSSLYCDGSDNYYFDTNWGAGELYMRNYFAVSFWWKQGPTTPDSNDIFFSMFDSGIDLEGRYASGPLHRFNVQAGGQDQRTWGEAPQESWSHYVWIHEKGTGNDKLRMFVNGTEVSLSPLADTSTGNGTSSINNLLIFAVANGPIQEMDAYVDDFLVFQGDNNVLSESEILTMYLGNYTEIPFADAKLWYTFDDADVSGSTVTDVSGVIQHNGTNVGATPGVEGMVNEQFSFADNNEVTFSNITLGEWCINFFFRYDSCQGGYCTITGDSSTYYIAYYTGIPRWEIYDSVGHYGFTSSPIISSDDHTYVSICYDGKNSNLYYNGTWQVQGINSVGKNFEFKRVGESYDGGLGLNGNIDEFSIYDYNFTSTQVASLYALLSGGSTPYSPSAPPPDISAPTWDEIPSDVILEYLVDDLSVDFNATDDTLIDSYYINDTSQFEIDDSTGVLFNTSPLLIDNFNILVSVNDTSNNINTTLILVTVQDTIAPSITSLTIDTTYNDTYNDPILWINLSVTDIGTVDTCTINDSLWALNFTDGTLFSFGDVSADEGFYAVIVSCNDTYDNSQSLNLYFTIDRVPPYITHNSPLLSGSTSVYTLGTFTVNLDASDDIALFNYNVTIVRKSDSLQMWTYYNDTISESSNITDWSLVEVLDVSSWDNTTYTYTDRLCDAHTKEKLKDKDKAKSIDKQTNKITYEFEGDLSIAIESFGGDEDSTDSIEGKDRYNPKFKYKKKTTQKKFKLQSNKNMVKISSSIYPGWFVIDGKYWVDFDDGLGSAVTVEYINDEWIITIDNDEEELTFNSIGPLNCLDNSFDFEFKHPYLPVITVFDPLIYAFESGFTSDVVFDIEADDLNVEDVLTYVWTVDGALKDVTEDYTYNVEAPLGSTKNVVVIVYDNSIFNNTDSQSWNITVVNLGYTITYDSTDLSPIVVDSIGTVGASAVGWTNFIITLLVVITMVGIVLTYFKLKK